VDGVAGVALAEIARAHEVPPEVLAPAVGLAVSDGYAELADGRVRVTPAGQVEVDRLVAAWREWLDERLDGWNAADPADRARLDRAVTALAGQLLRERRDRTPALA
jgi:hypothetical protein